MSIPEFQAEYATLVADDFDELKRALQAVSAWIILQESTNTTRLVDVSLLNSVTTWMRGCKEHIQSVRIAKEMQTYQNALLETVSSLSSAISTLESGVSGTYSGGTEVAMKWLHNAHTKLRYVSRLSPHLSMVDLRLGCGCAHHTKVG